MKTKTKAAGTAEDDDEPTTPIPQTLEDLRGHTPEELTDIVTVLDAHLRALHQTDEGEIRLMEPEEKKAFDIGVQIREKAIDLIEEHNAVAKVFARRPAAIAKAYRNLTSDLADGRSVVRMSVPEARDHALRLLDNRTLAAHLEADQKAQVEKLIRKSTDIARRILVTENEDYHSAFAKVTTQPRAFFTDDEERAMLAWQEYERAAAESPTSAGGFGIPVFIDPSIILTGQGSGNPFLTLARQVDVNTNAWKGVSSAGVSWSFQAEGATVADNAAVMAQPKVDVFMARGFIPYTIEIGQDYPSFQDEMQTLLASGYDELLVDKFSRGSGTNEPMGVITALDADTNAEVRLTTAGAFGEVDVYNVWKALPQKFRRKASWMMSVGANNAIRRFGTANVFHATTVNLPAEWADFLAGKAVYESPYFGDVVNTTGSFNQLVVGDFQNYLVARRGGMNVELIPTLFDITNNRPTGQRGWFAYARIGGGVINSLGFRLLNQT